MSAAFARVLRWFSLACLAAGVFLISLGPDEAEQTSTAMLPDGFDSTDVAAERVLEDDTSPDALVFFSGVNPESLVPLRDKATELGGPLIPNGDVSAAIVPVDTDAVDLAGNVTAIQDLRSTASDGLPPGVTAQVTGPAAINADLSQVFSGANTTLLAVTALIVAVLLVVTYRSPVLWAFPLLVIGVADRLVAVAYTWFLDALGMAWNESTGGILSVLVFGAGTNYAFLLISRYRDELTHREDRFEAMGRAWAPTVTAIAASALTVVVGVLCLLLSQTPTTRALGVAAAFGVIVALFFGAVVLPGILVLFGRWVFWPAMPKPGESRKHLVFDRVGAAVSTKPAAILAASLVVLGTMSLGSLQITTGLTQADQFLDTPESIRAAEELSDAFPETSATPAIIRTPDRVAATDVLEEAGFSVTDSAGHLRVSGGSTDEIRTALSGVEAKVGGPDAELVDTEEAAREDRTTILPLVLLLVLLSLIVILRSLVAPLVMTASVLLTNVAALGLGWWVSSQIFGFERFDSATPLYAFVFLVALGIDYTIFLVTRAREEAHLHGTSEAILRSLSSTGGVITSAGILLAAVFAALGVLPLVVLAQVGIVICLGVLLDTLVVRTFVVPAAVQLLGERFWWPARGRDLSR
ncbi:MMPL family transporter [Corynebacterium sp.]|uniref:MMPL family transporter n=1 Tax=Corynebacterium sp. TaxID=1720 RepID=UPI002A90FFD4|nr:MMPL family transporter [Corynebacterium sp.]MDY5785201.1 MMPL family transporter [Corynebacterium sp.]